MSEHAAQPINVRGVSDISVMPAAMLAAGITLIGCRELVTGCHIAPGHERSAILARERRADRQGEIGCAWKESLQSSEINPKVLFRAEDNTGNSYIGVWGCILWNLGSEINRQGETFCQEKLTN